MIIRKLTPEGYEDCFKVSAMAFIWPYDFEKKPEVRKENILLGAFEDDNKTLMANLELHKKKTCFGDGFVPAVGVGGVSTLPQYRRKGAVREMFKEIERMAEEEGWVFGLLYPFSSEYYRMFGYERFVKFYTITTDYTALNSIPRNTSVTLYEGENLQELLEIYNAFAKKYNFMMKREDNHYFPKDTYKECRYTYLWRDIEGVAKSFATYIKSDEDTITVQELAYTDKESLYGILGFLRTYDGNVKNIVFTGLPADSPLFEIISEQTKCKYRFLYRTSIRIFDVEAMLKLLEYPDEYGKVTIKFNDSIERNNGTFEIEYQNKKATIKRVESDNSDISLSMCAASRIFLSGEKFNLERLSFIKDVEINGNIDALLRILSNKQTLIWDFF